MLAVTSVFQTKSINVQLAKQNVKMGSARITFYLVEFA